MTKKEKCFCSDFVVVLSTWGMTQGLVMPFSGFLINAIGQKVMMDLITFSYSFTFQASMVIGSIIFSAGCALTSITIQQVYLKLFS